MKFAFPHPPCANVLSVERPMANELAQHRAATSRGAWSLAGAARTCLTLSCSAFLATALAATAAKPASAAADGYFAISYTVSLNGLSLGKGTFSGRVGRGAYRLKGDARLTGIAGVFFDYSALGEVDGYLGSTNHKPRKFSSAASDGTYKQSVAMSFSSRAVARMSLDPRCARRATASRSSPRTSAASSIR